MPGAATYTAAKAALHGLARSLAWEAGPDGVLVNTIAAGLTLTRRNRSRLPEAIRETTAKRTPSDDCRPRTTSSALPCS